MRALTEDLAPLARKHGVVLALQFGSTVSGLVHPGSDVDIAVLLDRPRPSLQEFAELLHDLQELFPEREVDLVLLNRADPLLLKKVNESCSVLYGTPQAFQQFRLYAFKRYQDHRKYLVMERRFVTRFLEEHADR